MNIVIQTHIKCSKCGSHRYERFERWRESGIRCLSCGHEKRDSLPEQSDLSTLVYDSGSSEERF